MTLGGDFWRVMNCLCVHYLLLPIMISSDACAFEMSSLATLTAIASAITVGSSPVVFKLAGPRTVFSKTRSHTPVEVEASESGQQGQASS